MNICSRLWCYFTTLTTHIADLEQYRQAKLLTAILGALISLSLFYGLLLVLFFPRHIATLFSIFSVVSTLFLAHALNRKGIYTSAAIITVAIPSFACLLVILENPNDIFRYSYLLVGIFCEYFINCTGSYFHHSD